MSKLVLLSLGGSGERVVNSLVMLMSAGMQLKDNGDAPMDLQPVFLDTDMKSNALDKAITSIRRYQELHRRFMEIRQQFGSSTLFVSNILDPIKIVIDGKQLASLKTLVEESSFDEDKKAELNMLFSGAALNVPLENGFIGLPYIGTVALNFLLNKGGEFDKVLSSITTADKIFFINSIFGGTGAAGFPLILNKIQKKTSVATETNTIALGALTLLPYFGVSKEVVDGTEEEIGGFTVNSAEFDSKSIAALMYYDQHLKKDGISSQYFIGSEHRSQYKKCLGGDKQENQVSMIEVFGATSVFHFANASVPRSSTNPNIKYYEYWFGTEDKHQYNLQDIPHEDLELKRALVRIQLFEYLMQTELLNYVKDAPGVFADAYDFKSEVCKNMVETKDFEDFFTVYDRWRSDLKSDSHSSSIQFNYFKKNPSSSQEMITECFESNISKTINRRGFLGLTHKIVVVDPDFLGKMSEGSQHPGKGWDTLKKENYTLYLMMYAIEKVLYQEEPKIVEL